MVLEKPCTVKDHSAKKETKKYKSIVCEPKTSDDVTHRSTDRHIVEVGACGSEKKTVLSRRKVLAETEKGVKLPKAMFKNTEETPGFKCPP